VPATVASPPDPTMIAQLANELFVALSGNPVPPAGALTSASSPVSAAGGSAVSVPGNPQGAGLIPPAETDPRTLPASPMGAAALLPANPASVPAQGAPGSPATAFDGARVALLNAPPVFPPIGELFSLPNVPGVQSPPGLPSLPSQTSPTQPTEAELRALPASLGDATTLVPEPSGAKAIGAAPGSSPYFVDAQSDKAAPFNAAPSFPGTSAIFTLPGVPGLGGERAAPAGATPPFEFRPEMVPNLEVSKRPFDPYLIRRDFPILEERVHGRRLVWLDNAATTQKPNAVIDRLSSYYRHENSNVHRAAHTLAARATDAFEGAREKVRRFLNASSTREIVFVRGTTEGINLVAQAWGRRNVEKGDQVVITWLEHHSNIVPWQQLCVDKGACLRVAPVDDRGQIMLEQYEKLLGPRTRIVAFSHVSNALGTILPAREMVEIAHRHGALVLIDGAQSVAHMREDVQALDCDFFVFSGHKIFAPTGVGVVYGKVDILDNTPPWQGGGSMIADVTFEKTVYQPAPKRFEAGTPNIADAVGLGAALDYVSEVGIESITRYEHELLTYATAMLDTVPGLRIIGTAAEKAGVISFVLDEIRAEDVGVALNQEGIALRAGHHCAQPILRRFGLEATVRPSLALYNTQEDIDALVAALLRIQAGRGHRKL
jgi:cysteine desulfurase / selenocysteine lyase